MKKLFALLMIAVFAALILCSCDTGLVYRYDNASKYKAGDVNLINSPKNLDIDWVSGRIRIEYGDGDTFTAKETVTSTSKTKNAPMYTWLDGDTLRIKFLSSGRYYLGSFGKVLTITLPKDAKLGKVEINAVSSDVILLDAETEEIKLNTVSGSVTANGCSANKLGMQAVSGSLHISDAEFDSIKFNGVSGKITYSGTTLPTAVDVQTVSGISMFEINENCGFTLDFRSVSGNKSIDMDVVEKDGKTVCGDGSSSINIESVSGGVTILKRS